MVPPLERVGPEYPRPVLCCCQTLPYAPACLPVLVFLLPLIPPARRVVLQASAKASAPSPGDEKQTWSSEENGCRRGRLALEREWRWRLVSEKGSRVGRQLGGGHGVAA